MLGCKEGYMTEDKISILLSDVTIEGDIVEKDKIIVDAKVSGDIKADSVETHLNSNIKGNVNSDQITIQKSANIEGVLSQKTLSIDEGALLKIKTETRQ